MAPLNVRVVGLVAHVEYWLQAREVLQVVGTEVDAVVVAVGAAVGDEAPEVIGCKVVARCEILDDLALEHLRRYLPRRVGKRVAGIVEVHQVDAVGIVPLIEVAQRRHLVEGIAKILGQRLLPYLHPAVQLLEAGTFHSFHDLFRFSFYALIRAYNNWSGNTFSPSLQSSDQTLLQDGCLARRAPSPVCRSGRRAATPLPCRRATVQP